jgi:hypothetical protein
MLGDIKELSGIIRNSQRFNNSSGYILLLVIFAKPFNKRFLVYCTDAFLLLDGFYEADISCRNNSVLVPVTKEEECYQYHRIFWCCVTGGIIPLFGVDTYTVLFY